MHARMSTLEGASEEMDEALRDVREHVMPQLKQQEGFKGFIALGNRQSGELIGITFWESEQAMQASEEVGDRTRSDTAEATGEAIEDVERYEVGVFVVNRSSPGVVPSGPIKSSHAISDARRLQRTSSQTSRCHQFVGWRVETDGLCHPCLSLRAFWSSVIWSDNSSSLRIISALSGPGSWAAPALWPYRKRWASAPVSSATKPMPAVITTVATSRPRAVVG